MKKIRLSKPHIVGKELDYLQEVITKGALSGNKTYTKLCHKWLERELGTPKALLTHSCTSALEMASILARIEPGDEVIMPSYTFVSTANAVVLRGGVPVFVDIRSDTQNIDEAKIEEAITPRTKAIYPVHYAGVGCEMDAIMAIAQKHELIVVEDAAQGSNSYYKGRHLGTIGHMGALSFHETKNLTSGEGGSLLLNHEEFIERAEIVWEKGTNRKQFFLNKADKYTWVDVGSSFLPSELTAAMLYAQLEDTLTITRKRLAIWEQYHTAFEALEQQGHIVRPVIPADCQHNAHIYYILLPNLEERDRFIDTMQTAHIGVVFHYVPLHSSPAGQKFGRAVGDLPNTQRAGERLVRLPLWPDMLPEQVTYIIDKVTSYFS